MLRRVVSTLLFISSTAMLASLVILPARLGSSIWLSPLQTTLLMLVPSLALVLLIVDRAQSGPPRAQEQGGWLKDEHVHQMIAELEDYAIFFLDPEGTVISWNKGAGKIKGYQADEIMGQHFSIFYPEEDRARGVPANNLEIAWKTGKLRTEGWRLRKDGTRFRADVLIVPYYDQKGNLSAYAKLTRDITPWHEARMELRNSQQRLAEAQRIARIGTWEWNLESDEWLWSQELYRIYGRDPESFTPSYESLLQAMPPEDRKKARTIVERSLQTGEPFQFGHQLIRLDGDIRTVYTHGQVEFDPQGQPIRMVGTGQDITERVRLERDYMMQIELNQSVVRAQNDLGQGVLITDGDNILFYNDVFAEIFNLPVGPIESIEAFLGLTGVDSESHLHATLTTTPTPTGRIERGQEFLNSQEGKYLEYAATSMRIHDQTRRIVLLQDITERKELHLSLEASREKLKRYSAELNRVIEQERAYIARQIHDELGQQLTGLKMDLSFLSAELSKTNHPDTPYFLQKFEEMMAMIEHSVDAVRKLATELRPGILDKLGLSAALEWQAAEFRKRTGVKCRYRGANLGRIEDEVATAMFRITQEALTNIARHARAENVEITLESNEDNVILQIKDDGRGISAESLMGKNSLGILGMRERAENLGGKTIIAPRSRKGTVIHVTIPMTPLEDDG